MDVLTAPLYIIWPQLWITLGIVCWLLMVGRRAIEFVGVH